MARIGLVYDLRLPNLSATQRSGQYRACLDQAAWADRVGLARIVLREHHGADDGYLPSPLVLAGGIGAVTRSTTIVLQALVVPLHDPVRLAEDLAVLDLMSGGRLVVVAGAGYVTKEYEMFGRSFAERPRLVERAIAILRRAWTGEPFELDGRRVQVLPRPFQDPGPPLLLGGASAAAARRAARIADGFLPVRNRFFADYRAALVAAGRPDPGPLPRTGPMFLYVAEDPEQAWHQIAPACLQENNAYGALARAAGLNTGFHEYAGADELRASGEYPIVTPDECVALCKELGDDGVLTIPPLAGGLDPDLSWRSLELIERRVLPHVPSHRDPPDGYRTSTTAHATAQDTGISSSTSLTRQWVPPDA